MTAFTPNDIRYIAGACLDDGALVYEHEIPALIEELENRNGEAPSEPEVIEYAKAEYRRRVDREAGSLAKYDTTVF